jgi:hypothetical protein
MIGHIDEFGKYRSGKSDTLNDVSSTYKEYSHDLGRKEYAKEIIQPHKNGLPNPQFVKAYRNDPVLKEYFSQEQIDQTERSQL